MATLLDIDTGRVATVATFYKASELLGAGRYSEVYRAFDTHSQADVALKLYVGCDSEAHEAARNEASILQRLGELNSEYFPILRRSAKHRIRNQNHPLLVLELGAYLGADCQKRVIRLKEVIPQSGAVGSTDGVAEEFWSVDALIRWIVHLVQAVKQMHSVGIVHRDIKPANLLLKRGPGQSQAVPFLLDFNSATGSSESDSGTGTPRYLPPEVKLGRRGTPRPEDDLWATAMVAWELMFGQSSSPEHHCSPHGLVRGRIPDDLVAALSRALCINPEARFPSANELLLALEASLPTQGGRGLALGSDEVARARTAMDRIRRVIGQALAPPGAIVIPKEIEESVTTIFAWMSQEDSQSLNLVEEIVRLGPVAIPACLQQGYRLQHRAGSYEEVVMALGRLGAQDPHLAQRSIDAYALSSNRGVRALCWRVCETLQYVPEILLESLTADEGVLLPEERLGIADLSLRFSRQPSAVLALLKYICREYILDRGRYRVIRDTVARRMSELQFPSTANVIWEECHKPVWRGLKEFHELSGRARNDPGVRKRVMEETEKGLIELMADAFAATGTSGLDVLKGRKAEWLEEPWELPVFRRFAVKSGTENPEVRAWLISQASRFPEDRDLQRIVEKLAESKKEKSDSPDTLLRDYLLSGFQGSFNKLRFWPDAGVLDRVGRHLSGRCSRRELDLILQLLSGYQNRHRPRVVDVLLTHWEELAAYDYDTAVDVLTAYPVVSGQLERAIAAMNNDLGGAHETAARRGLEQLLR
jgi:serine/threonine protein kinase